MHLSNALLAVCLTTAFLPSNPTNDELAEQRELARARYRKVESELARADLARLDAEQRVARESVLAILEAYVDRGDFGVQCEEPQARVPKFVDDDGRRCAMAELLFATGEGDLVERVRASNNEAWVAELAGDADYLQWLERHGLSLAESARIQGPAMSPPAPVEPPSTYDGPADVVPSTPTSSAPRGPSTRPAGQSPAPNTGPSAGPSTPRPEAAAAAAALTQSDAGWWQWWEFNKVEFLRPNRLALDHARDDGAYERTFASQVEFTRQALLPALLRALADPDARVRAAAARAVGRIGGASAVPQLVARLGDASLEVRDMAMLGLGATGAPEAQAVLVQIAREGRAPGASDVGRRGRALAIVALGLGRSIGFDESADRAVAEVLTSRAAIHDETLGIAAMTYALLSPDDGLSALAYELASDKGEPVEVRCRAAEALRDRRDAATLGRLQQLASGSRVDLRRSAALALGEVQNALVPAALMTAHDLEKEPLTRGFLLISLGRRGGDGARDYLIDVLKRGPGEERAWAALALGMVARETGDALAARTLREAVAQEKRAGDRSAYWLALGLAHDAQAFEILKSGLWNSADPTSRMHAAQALAMLRGDEAHTTLRERLAVETSSLVRSQIALALGVLGQPGDVDPIADMLVRSREATLQGQFAAAMAFHGSTEALHRLGTMVSGEALDGAARAAAIDSLGMLLGRGEALALGAASRSSNFTLFGDWLSAAVMTTL